MRYIKTNYYYYYYPNPLALSTFTDGGNRLFSHDKLSLVVMQLLEKYKENFDFSSEGPTPYIFQVVASLYQRKLSVIIEYWHYIHCRHRQFFAHEPIARIEYPRR